MRLLWQSFLREPFHEHLFLFVAGENGIHERDAVVFRVQLCNFFPAWQQLRQSAAKRLRQQQGKPDDGDNSNEIKQGII